jgi:hypothetical protein
MSKCPSKAQLIEILAKDLIHRKPSIYRGYEADARIYVKNNYGPSRRDMMLVAVNYKLVPTSCWRWPRR